MRFYRRLLAATTTAVVVGIAGAAILPVFAQTRSNDCLTVTIDQTEVTEGGAIGYTVSLPSAPAPGETVTISPEGFNAERMVITPESRDFTIDNWQRGRVFTIVVPENSDVDPGVVFTRLQHRATSSRLGSRFDGMQACAPITLTIRDNDSGIVLPTGTPMPTATPDRSRPGITFEPAAAEVREGETVVVMVSVIAPPRMNESLTVFPLFDPVMLAISPNTRDLNFSNWDRGGEFTFTAPDDANRQGDRTATITFYITSSDPYSLYFNLTDPTQLTVTIRDND